jgi:hypothetical protein
LKYALESPTDRALAFAGYQGPSPLRRFAESEIAAPAPPIRSQFLYPILTFPEVPAVEVALINRPDQPSHGAGEAASAPVAAALANAVFDATGVRLRSVPFTPARVKAAFATADTKA